MNKLILLIIFATLNFENTFSQKFIETHYNINREAVFSSDDARFYSLSTKTDSGWYTKEYLLTMNKLQMLGLFEDKENTIKNGIFYWFYPNGKIKTIGKYVHNNKQGIWLQYNSNGSLYDSSNYINGNLQGISLSWYKDGFLKDSFNIDEKGSGIHVSWFDNGQPSSAGRYVNYIIPHGRWNYYHKNGKVSAVELYDNGVLKDKQYFDESGAPANTTLQNAEAKFPGGDKAWGKYLNGQLYFPQHLEFKNGYTAALLITGTINEDGKVIDAEGAVPLHPEFDRIALNAIKKSPPWIPAVSHNRKVYYSFRQQVTFGQITYVH